MCVKIKVSRFEVEGGDVQNKKKTLATEKECKLNDLTISSGPNLNIFMSMGIRKIISKNKLVDLKLPPSRQ